MCPYALTPSAHTIHWGGNFLYLRKKISHVIYILKHFHGILMNINWHLSWLPCVDYSAPHAWNSFLATKAMRRRWFAFHPDNQKQIETTKYLRNMLRELCQLQIPWINFDFPIQRSFLEEFGKKKHFNNFHSEMFTEGCIYRQCAAAEFVRCCVYWISDYWWMCW